ncbi:coiled-coil domain-containing protein 157-like [Anthonomus grandis grandis]|uniref:coiled-coil domain-containing protein 157-like n=1 Tax=Anthonomus grandis grandis TaxID=2921223 RepID=UPI0021658F23|nr:coiled-coil domain-containing protein 157-like [Anthonomus grandis grandis]
MYVNKTLALTLRQDILSINRLLQEISKTYQLELTNSWLFPTKSCSVLCETIINQSLDEYPYEKCLEILVDRLYVFNNIILLHLKKEKRSTNSSLVVQPTKPSIGISIRLIWEYITKLCNTRIQQQKIANKLTTEELMDRASQTDICSLNRCDSCSSAISCMKSILRTFEAQKDRVNLKYQILDITQFGSMMKATSSIEETLQNLYRRLHNEVREKDKLKNDNEQLINKIKGYESKTDFLEEEVRVLRKELEKDAQEITTFKEENSKLSELTANQYKKISHLEKTLNNFSISFQSMSKGNCKLKSQNKILQSNVETSLSLLRKCHSSLTSKLLKLDDEFIIIKAILEQYEKSVKEVNAKLVKIVKNIGKIDLKVTHKFDTKEALQELQKYEDFCVKIKEIFKEKLEKSKPSEIVSIKGNPVEDISRQIDDNNSKISILQKENGRLEILLNRFKGIQRK